MTDTTDTNTPGTRALRYVSLCLLGIAGAAFGLAAVQSVEARRGRTTEATSGTPEIRTSSANTVPACIKADRLQKALVERNPKLETKFRTIAQLYQQHGEKLRIRWDYAFYQMVHETNALLYTGDVKPSQNNFAGLGATGGGVRGESFKDVSSGVLAHLQHLVAYSGEMVDNPVAERTREHQDGIVSKSQKLGRPVRFADLTNRWAMDSKYTRHLEATAERFRAASCDSAPDPVADDTTTEPTADTRKQRRNRNAAATETPPATSDDEPLTTAAQLGQAQSGPSSDAEGDGQAKRGKERQTANIGRDMAKKAIQEERSTNTARSGLGVTSSASADCNVMAASFGGSVTLLIRAESPDKAVNFTALGVEGGSEDAMAESYMKVHAPGGKITGRFKSRDDAVAHAYALCDSGKP